MSAGAAFSPVLDGVRFAGEEEEVAAAAAAATAAAGAGSGVSKGARAFSLPSQRKRLGL